MSSWISALEHHLDQQAHFAAAQVEGKELSVGLMFGVHLCSPRPLVQFHRLKCSSAFSSLFWVCCAG
jgi:hypothetical protein